MSVVYDVGNSELSSKPAVAPGKFDPRGVAVFVWFLGGDVAATLNGGVYCAESQIGVRNVAGCSDYVGVTNGVGDCEVPCIEVLSPGEFYPCRVTLNVRFLGRGVSVSCVKGHWQVLAQIGVNDVSVVSYYMGVNVDVDNREVSVVGAVASGEFDPRGVAVYIRFLGGGIGFACGE